MTALDRLLAARAELAAAEGALLGERAGAVAALRSLLIDVCSADELRREVRYKFPALVAGMPGTVASPATLAANVAEGLLLFGVDAPTLRAWLVAERPRRVGDIDTALAVWGAL